MIIIDVILLIDYEILSTLWAKNGKLVILFVEFSESTTIVSVFSKTLL